MTAPIARDEDNPWVWLAAAAIIGPGAAAWAVLQWSRLIGWLLEHAILVPASARPVLIVPGSGGAGLDFARVAVAGLVAGWAVGVAVLVGRRAVARKVERR